MSRIISISNLDHWRNPEYGIHALSLHWKRMGLQPVIDKTYDGNADICLLHHDLTRLDASKLPAPPDGVRVINGKALDISKRLYSVFQLRPDDDWHGPVIIKSNLNYFGLPERKLSRVSRFRKLRERLSRHSWRLARLLPRRTYPVLERISDVPDWVWRNPDLLVERFMPERDGELFCLRGWMFFGNRGYGYRIFASDPLVKTGSMVRYEYLDGFPDKLMAYREQLGIEYGKFDYVEHDCVAYLLDANKTPSIAGEHDTPRLRNLAEGILDFL